MKILINDHFHTQENYQNIFGSYGYERNELIFRNSFQETKEFIVEQLANRKQHIDLIITNETSREGQSDILKSQELWYLKHSLAEDYSNNNFRISSIPIILYSDNENKTRELFGYDAIVQKNSSGKHDYFLNRTESTILSWRNKLLADLDVLGIRPKDLRNFPISESYKEYRRRVVPRTEQFFSFKTKVVSFRFIRCPSELEYDWIIKTAQDIELPQYLFDKTLRRHKKYSRHNNERTIWHQLFLENSLLITRDVYNGFHYEKNLNENEKGKSQECDFILTTDFPDQLSTTFLEVKREDKQYYVNKKSKSPQFSYDFIKDLKQVWRYKRYVEDPQYFEELSQKITYPTKKFDYTLLAGSKEEKEEMQELFQLDMKDHFPGIEVKSFEEFGDVYANYVNKFQRLKIPIK
jgi:hypothetical protein